MAEGTITVYGASDDLIEVEGAIREEFDVLGEDGCLVAFANGIVLRVTYGNEGVWRIDPVSDPDGKVDIRLAPEDDEDNYSDRATVPATAWVVCLNRIAYAKTAVST